MADNTPTKPRGCTNYKIRQLMRRVSQHYDTEIGRAGVKATQYALMSHIITLGPVRPGELAQAMRIDASTFTCNLRLLADGGWIQLEAGSEARSRSVSITDAGREKWAEAHRYWKNAQTHINTVLGVERVNALHALIDESLDLLPPADSEAGRP